MRFNWWDGCGIVACVILALFITLAVVVWAVARAGMHP